MKRLLVLSVAILTTAFLFYGLGFIESTPALGQRSPVDTRGDRPDFAFRLDLEGEPFGFFRVVSGIGSESEIIEHKVVDESNTELVRKIPGRLKWNDITLKRGITENMDLWTWRKLVEQGNAELFRKNGSIVLVDRQKVPMAQWDFKNAWPSKISGPQPKSDGNDVFLTESLTITHEFIERVY